MKRKQSAGKFRGFTLLELVVVLSIIAILTAILIPTTAGYLKRSRLNTANANAKVLFNSMQTLCQEFEFAERAMDTSIFYGDNREGAVFLKSDSQPMNTANYGHVECLGLNGSTLTPADVTAALNLADATNVSGTEVSTFQNRLIRLFEDCGSISWAAYIVDYQVKAVICADTDANQYLGAYPARTTDSNEFGTTMMSLSATDIHTYAQTAWGRSYPEITIFP